MKDRKLAICLFVLPVTVLFTGAALAAELTTTKTAGSVPQAFPVTAETFVNIPIETELQAVDQDNDIVLYQLTEQPRLGTAAISNSTLTYSPGKKAGKDQFSYTAIDINGNTAPPAKITISVQKNKTKLTYVDMTGNPAHYHAIRLAQENIMTGEIIGDCAFFHPSQTVTRSEFIAMVIAMSKSTVKPTTVTDFADDSGLSAWAKPFISTAAAQGIVHGYQTAGSTPEIRGSQPITLAEASVIISNLLNNAADNMQYVATTEHSSHPDWAQQAVSNMIKMDILSPALSKYQNHAPITRCTACEMLCNAMDTIKKS